LGTVAEIKSYNISEFRDIPTASFPSTSFLVKTTFLSRISDLYFESLSQLLDYGFYHADPHPGNFLLTYDNKLAYLGRPR
ncbi:hypothetical protein CLOP_g10367, partial [Closterium sp. NIES-67]